MSDRIKALTVVLRNDVNEDDAKSIMDAIRQFRNVIAVSGVSASIEDYVANERARFELLHKLSEVLL